MKPFQTKEDDMKRGNEIAKISFDIDTKELEKIADSGRLEEFTTRVTELFNRYLKFELVKNKASSGTTSFYRIHGDFGNDGPWPPQWLDNAEVESVITRIDALEKSVFQTGK